MSEASGGRPPQSYSGDRARELSGIKPKQGLFRRFLGKITDKPVKLGTAATIAAGAVAAEAIAHPVENTAGNITSAAVQGAEDIKKAGEGLVDFYNEDPAIRQKSEEIAGKLNGTIPLSEGEQIFEEVKIVPAGDINYSQLEDMEEGKTVVKIRNYPGTYTPDGRFSSIIGELHQGDTIKHVIYTEGTRPHPSTANEPAKWWAYVYRPVGSDPNEPGKIGYVYGIYGTAQAVGEAASSAPTPSEAPTNQ